ncbi:MAG TPA: AraC family transcriptional regulator [Gemmatimonas aurantiaca]|nr:AraC family transcriptional regulator [Gemmatimonas aurantiaca]
MINEPHYTSNRPTNMDDSDVVSDILRAVRLSARVFGRFEASAPWAMRVPGDDYFAFYLLARGSAWLELTGGDTAIAPVALSAGDVVLLPHGGSHVLRDAEHSMAVAHEVGANSCPRPTTMETIRMGGGGTATTFVAGAFRFGAEGRGILLETLPPVLHVAAGDADMGAALAATIQLILAESANPAPGGALLSTRLAEILLVQALRVHTRRTYEANAAASDHTAHAQGLCALADPHIGAALRLMHARPADTWTVASLAHEVGQSRSAFAARFAELVGESPLQYLTRWRMTQAAEWLRDRSDSVPAIAQRVGYGNAAAFMKAFTRVQGQGPGAYRRAHRQRLLADSAPSSV